MINSLMSMYVHTTYDLSSQKSNICGQNKKKVQNLKFKLCISITNYDNVLSHARLATQVRRDNLAIILDIFNILMSSAFCELKTET